MMQPKLTYLISGKVNRVSYQPGKADAFYHRYSYDAENRLTEVETSRDRIYWEREAQYSYYKHGPLAGTITGQMQVQSLTNAYTLQGWVKGIVPGNDANTKIAGQAFDYSLNYYTGDYSAINATVFPEITAANFKPLYNGNIAAMMVSVPKLGEPVLHTYKYDQLNRIKEVNNYKGYNAAANSWQPTDEHKEAVSFDPNGNIQNALLNGNSAQLAYENFSYSYDAVKQNRLLSITNAVNSTTYNYEYDAIGNVTKDELEGNSQMQWNVYGKLTHVVKTNGTTIDYSYDAAGNRISKTLSPLGGAGGGTKVYVRDASGNVMATYLKDAAVNSGNLSTEAFHIYGSSMLGRWKAVVDVESSYTLPAITIFTRGEKKSMISATIWAIIFLC